MKKLSEIPNEFIQFDQIITPFTIITVHHKSTHHHRRYSQCFILGLPSPLLIHRHLTVVTVVNLPPPFTRSIPIGHPPSLVNLPLSLTTVNPPPSALTMIHPHTIGAHDDPSTTTAAHVTHHHRWAIHHRRGTPSSNHHPRRSSWSIHHWWTIHHQHSPKSIATHHTPANTSPPPPPFIACFHNHFLPLHVATNSYESRFWQIWFSWWQEVLVMWMCVVAGIPRCHGCMKEDDRDSECKIRSVHDILTTDMSSECLWHHDDSVRSDIH